MDPASELPEDNLIAFAKYVQKRLPSQAFLLDAGCGRGRNTLYLSQRGFSVYGCDLSLAALETARKRTQQAGLPGNFQRADLTCSPYAKDSFAVMVCTHVLPYRIKINITKGLHELRRVMRPGGWLYADFLDCDDAEYGCGQKMEENTFLDPDGIPVHFSSRQEISDLLNGFTIERASRCEWRSPSSRIRVIWKIWAVKCEDEQRTIQTY